MEDRFIILLKMLMKVISFILVLCVITVAAAIYFTSFYDPNDFASDETSIAASDDIGEVKDGIHISTGFIVDSNLKLVIGNCTSCHSAKLVTQNRATREGWKSIIEWMQETQNLPDLGANEEKIIEYLAKNYAPEQQGRRKPLENIEWYELP